MIYNLCYDILKFLTYLILTTSDFENKCENEDIKRGTYGINQWHYHKNLLEIHYNCYPFQHTSN